MSTEIAEQLERIIQQNPITDVNAISFISPIIKMSDTLFQGIVTDPESESDIKIYIDTLDIPQELVRNGLIQMQAMKDYFSQDFLSNIMKFSETYANQIPLSAFFEAHVGECTQIAIASQLYFQRLQTQSYICAGKTSRDSAMNVMHAWNLVKNKHGVYHIWDCSLGVFAPLGQIHVSKQSGLVLVPDFKAKGAYSLEGEFIYQICGEDFWDHPMQQQYAPYEELSV